MATSHETNTSCQCANYWQEGNFIPEAIANNVSNVQQLFVFDRSRAIRRTELELHRIRQFASEVGVTVPYHFWDALRRVLTLRFGWPSLQCPCCEDSDSKMFIMSVIALAFFNPDLTCNLFVDVTIKGWINQVAGHLLVGANVGEMSQHQACNILSDLFAAIYTTGGYKRPTFRSETSMGSLTKWHGLYDYLIIMDPYDSTVNKQIVQLSEYEVRFAVLSQSNDRAEGLRVDSNVLYLNIPQDRKLSTETYGSFLLHSLKKLSLMSIMGSVNSPGKSIFHIKVKDFKIKISSFYERLTTIQDGECLAAELKQLKQTLEKFTESTIFSQNCTLHMPSLSPHGKMYEHIHLRFWNSNKTVDLLLQHSNLLHTVLEDLRQETFTRNLSEMNRVPNHEAIGQNTFVWFLSSLKALEHLFKSRPPGLLDNELEAKHLESSLVEDLAELDVWRPMEAYECDLDKYHDLFIQNKFERRHLWELHDLLNAMLFRFLLIDQLNNFTISAIRLQITLCYLLSKNLIVEILKGGICIDGLFVPTYLQDVYNLDEFGLNLREVTDTSLIHFFIARLLDNVKTIETYVEHVGKVYDSFSEMIDDVRLILNRDLYARICLKQLVLKQADIDALLDGIDLSPLLTDLLEDVKQIVSCRQRFAPEFTSVKRKL